jgi:hypothetical protein
MRRNALFGCLGKQQYFVGKNNILLAGFGNNNILLYGFGQQQFIVERIGILPYNILMTKDIAIQ